MSRRKWGALRKLPSGSYQARITDLEGNRHVKTFPTMFLAEKYLEAMAREIHGKDFKKYKIARGKRIRSYGIQVDEFNEMMLDQDGKCYICSGDNGLIALCIDHDHKTGKVRGLLCNRCNRGLGLFQDEPALLIRAVDYLENGVIPIPREYPPLKLVGN
jgi:hypothetical protein